MTHSISIIYRGLCLLNVEWCFTWCRSCGVPVPECWYRGAGTGKCKHPLGRLQILFSQNTISSYVELTSWVNFELFRPQSACPRFLCFRRGLDVGGVPVAHSDLVLLGFHFASSGDFGGSFWGGNFRPFSVLKIDFWEGEWWGSQILSGEKCLKMNITG